MADHRRRLHQQRDRRDRVRRQGRGCHFPIWAVLPELIEEEERVRWLDQELKQVAELEDQP
jgi:hypothetical protein